MSEDGRGPDTVNRTLLHGARHHDREAVFLKWNSDSREEGWDGMPDWRADRNSIRIGLVLSQRLELGSRDRVALWLPLTREWPLIERGAWAIGAHTVPVWREWSLDRVARVLADARPVVLFAQDRESVERLRGFGDLPDSIRAIVVLHTGAGEDKQASDQILSYREFLEYGGVLDTAERAAMWRTTARSARPEDPISLEYVPTEDGLTKGYLTHEALLQTMQAIRGRVSSAPGTVHVITDERPDSTSRALLYAAWADGWTRVALVSDEEEWGHTAELSPALIACREGSLATVLGSQPAGGVQWVLLTDADTPGRNGHGDTEFEGRMSFLRASEFAARLAQNVPVGLGS